MTIYLQNVFVNQAKVFSPQNKELLISSENKINEFNGELNEINEQLTSQESEIVRKISLFNEHFSKKSISLYGESTLLNQYQVGVILDQ
jgi:hypothetical protein